MVSKATRVHKVANKATRDAPDKVLKAELNLRATRETKVVKADAVIKAWAIPLAAEAQAVIKIEVVVNTNDCKLSKLYARYCRAYFYYISFLFSTISESGYITCLIGCVSMKPRLCQTFFPYFYKK